MVRPSPGHSPKDLHGVSMLLDDQLCFALYSATHRIQRLYRPRLDALGLTYSQYLVLLVLWEKDGLAVSEIGDRLFLKSATLTPLLKRMETAELIRRRRSSEDERVVDIWLTDAGRKLRSQVRQVTSDVSCAAEEATHDAAELLRQLHDLRDGLPNQ